MRGFFDGRGQGDDNGGSTGMVGGPAPEPFRPLAPQIDTYPATPLIPAESSVGVSYGPSIAIDYVTPPTPDVPGASGDPDAIPPTSPPGGSTPGTPQQAGISPIAAAIPVVTAGAAGVEPTAASSEFLSPLLDAFRQTFGGGTAYAGGGGSPLPGVTLGPADAADSGSGSGLSGVSTAGVWAIRLALLAGVGFVAWWGYKKWKRRA